MVNNRFLQALRRQPVDSTPLWMMRQAGRYLPEYRELRQKARDFLDFCHQPALCVEAMLQPLRRFDLDAAILFSDILVIPHAMGMNLAFKEGEGPVFSSPIRTADDLKALKTDTLTPHLSYVFETLDRVKPLLQVPLLGFAGSPWTLATYMIEGRSSKLFRSIKTLLYQKPQVVEELLALLSTHLMDYLSHQIQAGADAVMIFDSWGGILTTPDYHRFSLKPMQRMVQGLKKRHPHTPIILFTKGGGQWLEAMANTGADALSLDWITDLAQARQRVGHRVALQGNLDPLILYGSPDTIRSHSRRILEAYGEETGHIFNLGHGIDPHTPPENVTIMIDTVREYCRNKRMAA
ncbi:MAG TPA: uroporphyrinogen decarboxylase [Coxiellaceae bacterium]|nr:uroporphyrinogen decarboxylase [Coxiellaceae bacterium]